MSQEIRRLLQTLDMDAATVRDDESLHLAGILHSLALIELLTALESTYGIRIESAEVTVENFDTIRDIVAFVAEKRQADPAG